ncbi:origin recognition complex subunit 6 [Battus philenor]|uniref:origin recognition complex subunit 6 n=1 Tax=Battus philenor TaxID=42288 RepID=UPI0035CF1A43
MSSCSKTLQLLASKLGLENEEKVLWKAAELERLLQTKTIAGSNITDTSKVIICLDLASNACGVDLDLKMAIKYSGLKQPTYINTKKIIENLLELGGEKITISSLCLNLQCNVQGLAEEILEEYRNNAKMEIDLNLPQYVAMAVFQAARIKKVKISKSKLIEKSRIKPAQWAKLDAEWTKFVDENFASTKSKKSSAKKVSLGNDVSEKMEIDVPNIEESTEPQIEPYEDWKRRMLEEAYKELRALEELERNQKSMTPRRSPRKTPQKHSPYKMISKGNGVKLLFPTDL